MGVKISHRVRETGHRRLSDLLEAELGLRIQNSGQGLCWGRVGGRGEDLFG